MGKELQCAGKLAGGNLKVPLDAVFERRDYLVLPDGSGRYLQGGKLHHEAPDTDNEEKNEEEATEGPAQPQDASDAEEDVEQLQAESKARNRLEFRRIFWSMFAFAIALAVSGVMNRLLPGDDNRTHLES